MKNLVLKEKVREVFKLYPSRSKDLYSFEEQGIFPCDLPDELASDYDQFQLCHLVNTCLLRPGCFRTLFYESYIANGGSEDLVNYAKTFVVEEHLNH